MISVGLFVSISKDSFSVEPDLYSKKSSFILVLIVGGTMSFFVFSSLESVAKLSFGWILLSFWSLFLLKDWESPVVVSGTLGLGLVGGFGKASFCFFGVSEMEHGI